MGIPQENESIIISNDFSKTINFGSNAIGRIVNDIFISSAAFTNTLLLDGGGVENPLQVRNNLAIGKGGDVLLVDSALLLGRGVLDIEGNLSLLSGELVATNSGSIVYIGYSGSGKLSMYGGKMLSWALQIGYAPGVESSFVLAGGTNFISDFFGVGLGPEATGSVWVTGGYLESDDPHSPTLLGGGNGGNGGIGILNISNGIVNVRNIAVGYVPGSLGVINLAGGTITVAVNAFVGSYPGATGAVYITGGMLDVGGPIIGHGGDGSLTISNGAVSDRGTTAVGAFAGSRGTLTVAGGFYQTPWLIVGGVETGATGTAWITGGTLSAAGVGITLGVYGGNGKMVVSNGLVTATDLILGTNTNARGELDVVGGIVQILNPNFGSVFLGESSSSIGTIKVMGGQFIVTNTLSQIGRFGTGQLLVSTGVVLASETQIAAGGNSVGSLEISGGMMIGDGDMTVGAAANATGMVLVTGGELSLTNADLVIGANGGVGEVLQALPGGSLRRDRSLRRPHPLVAGGGGGVLRANSIIVADDGVGTLTAAGGTITASSDIIVGTSETSTGTVVVGSVLETGGDFILSHNPRLEIQLSGYTPGTEAGLITVSNTASFAGTLAVRLVGSFASSITNGASFTVLKAGAISGAFTNVASGQRLVTEGGEGSFLVTYPDSNLVLSDFRDAFSRPTAGVFTMLLAHDPGDAGPSFPQGDGYAVLKINDVGKVTGNGALADGTRLKLTGNVSANGRWSVSAAGGSVTGTVSFTSETLTGSLTWTKPANAKSKYYSNGFTTHLVAVGSRYAWPPVNQASFTVSFEDGNLNAPLDVPVTLNEHFKAKTPIKLSIRPKTGKFTGKFTHPATGKAAKFSGVILQEENSGGGFFFGINECGAVTFTPSP